MKSTIKVSYQNRHTHPLSEREPVIKIDLKDDNDDPRDILLKDLFDGNTLLGVDRQPEHLRIAESNIYGETILIYKKGFSEIVWDIATNIFDVLSIEHGASFDLGHENSVIFFRIKHEPEYRSKGVNPDEFLFASAEDFKRALVKDFKDFCCKYLGNMCPNPRIKSDV
jgi:hypothetical protein